MVVLQHSREGDLGVPPICLCTGTPASPLSPHSCFGTCPPRCGFSSFPCYRQPGEHSAGTSPAPGKAGPAEAPAQPADSRPPLPFAICLMLPHLQDPFSAPRDSVFHYGTAKFIRCQALYIPHNSASQALLCMCLIFTVKKTNGQSDSPDTLEGWAPALPWQNLGVNSISDPRLYFLRNTPVVFKSP